MKKKVALLLIASVVFVFTVGFQLWDSLFHPVVITKTEPLTALIPEKTQGWVSEELPLGQTEQVRAAALNRLNFNDYFSRIYRKGTGRVTVYIAYWEPLQMPVRQVGSHTPDVCWVLNGWECEKIENDVRLPFGNTLLKSAERREFVYKGTREYVLFWHLINGKVYKAENKIGMWDRWNMITDQIRFGLNQKPEQYFVRISSNQPLQRVWDDPGFQELLRAIAEAVNLDVPPGTGPEEWTYQFVI